MSVASGNRPQARDAGDDARPQFRVALFGVARNFERMLEIVARHARHNQFRYTLATDRTASNFDIALVDMTVAGGPEVASTLHKLLNGRPVLRLGRRTDASRGADDVTHHEFAARIIGALNRYVENNLPRNADYLDPSGLNIDSLAPELGDHVLGDDPDIPDARRPRALIVDDSPTVRRQLAVALGQMGMDSESVSGADEAMELLALREYELVFADVVMPGQDGYQLTRQIRRDKSLKGTPVIILTSRSSPFDLAKGALAGCSSYLVKPVSLQSLRDTVNRQLNRAIVLRKRSAELIGLPSSA